jgi:hypothetical protein
MNGKKWLFLAMTMILGLTMMACATTTTTTESPYNLYDHLTTFQQMWNRPVASGDYLVYLYSPASESCDDLKDLIFGYADDAESPYPIYFMDISTAPSDAQAQFIEVTGVAKLSYPAVVLVKDKSFDSTAQSQFYYAGVTRIRSLFYDLDNGIDPFTD